MKRSPYHVLIGIAVACIGIAAADAAESAGAGLDLKSTKLALPADTFCKCFQLVYDNTWLRSMGQTFADFADVLLPGSADLNGSSWVDASYEPTAFDLGPSGTPDCAYELKLLEVVLNDRDFSLPNGLTHSLAQDAWDRNEAQLMEDIGQYWTLFEVYANGLPQILNGFMILGDGYADYSIPEYVSATGSAGFVQCLMFMLGDSIANPKTDLTKYTRLPWYFAKAGDADGDGYTNYEEYLANASNPDAYVAAALNPSITPDTNAQPQGVPTAAFSAGPRIGQAPLTVAFADESDPGNAPIAAWFWDFGDGATSEERHPTHVYDGTGAYTVALTVTTATGSDIEVRTNYVTAYISPVGPTAAFDADRTAGLPPLTVRFTDRSFAGSAPIVSWLWDFGDGSIAAERNPVHVYAALGEYTVSLQVITDLGRYTAIQSRYIKVGTGGEGEGEGEGPSCFGGITAEPKPPTSIPGGDTLLIGAAVALLIAVARYVAPPTVRRAS